VTPRLRATGLRALGLALVAVLAVGPAAARAAELPARHQALLLLRVLAYDRNLRQRAQSAVTVVVLFRPGDRASEDRVAALVAAFEEVAHEVVVGGLPVRIEGVPYRDAPELEARFGGRRPSLAYIDPGLSLAVGEITQSARRRGVLTADGSRALVEAGVAVGVVAQANRASLIVNLKAARLEGADFDAALLAVSDVLQD